MVVVVVVQSLRRVQLFPTLWTARNGFKMVRISASPELGKVRTGTIRMVPCKEVDYLLDMRRGITLARQKEKNVLGSGIVVSEG